MNKRAEQRKQRGRVKLLLLRKILGVGFCIALLVFAINAADISTRRMIMCNDDKYALAVSLQQDSILRIDIAGEKLLLDVEPIVLTFQELAAGTRNCRDAVVEFIANKTRR